MVLQNVQSWREKNFLPGQKNNELFFDINKLKNILIDNMLNILSLRLLKHFLLEQRFANGLWKIAKVF